MLKVKRLHPDAIIPTKNAGDAGYDLYAIEDVSLYGYWINDSDFNLESVRTGVAIELPKGFVGLIKDRSSMGRNGLIVRGGVCDPSFTGEYIVMLANLSNSPYFIKKGDKVAQLVVVPYYDSIVETVEELSKTERGDKGFGSSGR